MMIGSETYIEEIKDKSYEELLEEKKRLIEEISKFEYGEYKTSEILVSPDPDVRYQCNLEYLSKLCILIAQKYNKKINKIN